MDFSSVDLHRQLSYGEANILMENLHRTTELGHLIVWLDTLLKNTEDERLRAELNSLIPKLKDLTPKEFEKLREDTVNIMILFPMDYTF